jgi:hypothetical protein
MSDRKLATKRPDARTRVIAPRVRGELRRVRLRLPATARIVLSPPRHAQMRPECVPISGDRRTSAVANSDDTDEGTATCAP